MNGSLAMNKCPKCDGLVVDIWQGDDATCLNCGWYERPNRVVEMFSVRYYSGQVLHYDPADFNDKTKLMRFLTVCPGSHRTGYMLGSSIRCGVCQKMTDMTKDGRTKAHLPRAWLARLILESVGAYEVAGSEFKTEARV